MEKKIIRVLTMFFVVSALFLSCKKDETVTGKGEIKGFATYNTKTIKPATFYIKYGVTVFPGSDVSKYDRSGVLDIDGKFDFKELAPGDYYIYAVASDNNVNLSGGIHLLLTQDELKDNVEVVVNP